MYFCDRPYVMLDVQYRMKPSISKFPSESFYGSKITNGPNVISSEYCGPLALIRGDPFTFLDVNGKESRDAFGSTRNVEEAQAVCTLLKDYGRLASQKDVRNCFTLERIRVITFYQAQVNLLRNLLRKEGLSRVMVSTVDSSQGCEADVIIISFVRRGGERNDPKHAVGFLTDDRRINVALTRAKYQLICVGNAYGLKASKGAETIVSFLGHCENTDSIVKYNPERKTDGHEQRTKHGKKNGNGGHKKKRNKGKKRNRSQFDHQSRDDNSGDGNGHGKKIARTAGPLKAHGKAGP